jgi:cobalt transporter subunit CbtB
MMSDKSTATALASQSVLASRAIQITFAALLGLVVIGGAGFAQIEALHNAAHDYRHSMGFPCH